MDDVDALTTILGVLKQLDADAQKRVLNSVQTFLGLAPDSTTLIRPSDQLPPRIGSVAAPEEAPGSFSTDRPLSAKEFIRDKHPQSDVERVACLAYYLTHYRDTPHFKTIDISALNTESAQPKFSNTSVAVDNATKQGYLVAATKGNKQLSALGERYVELLPDREGAREILSSMRRKPRSKGSK